MTFPPHNKVTALAVQSGHKALGAFLTLSMTFKWPSQMTPLADHPTA